jgi:hypothetical protein
VEANPLTKYSVGIMLYFKMLKFFTYVKRARAVAATAAPLYD